MTTFWLVLRSGLFWLGFVLSTFLYGLFAPIQYLFPYATNYKIIDSWGRLNIWWLKVTCHIDYQVLGKENIPQNQAVVIMSNHQSTWETLAFPQIFPRITWVCKKDLLRIPFFGWGFSHLKPIAIDREESRTALLQVKKQGKERMAAGISVVIFPEGTRTHPEQKLPYKPGGATLASAGNYHILPVAHNAGYYWPRHGFLKKPGIITVSIGKTIDSTGLKSKEIMQQVEQWIENERQQISRITPNPVVAKSPYTT